MVGKNPNHVTVTFKPYDWQKYGHKFQIDDCLESGVKDSMFRAVQEDREIMIPVSNIQSIISMDQDEWDRQGRDRRDQND